MPGRWRKEKGTRLPRRVKSVLLISCVLWIFFSERWQSTLFQIFPHSKSAERRRLCNVYRVPIYLLSKTRLKRTSSINLHNEALKGFAQIYRDNSARLGEKGWTANETVNTHVSGTWDLRIKVNLRQTAKFLATCWLVGESGFFAVVVAK